MFVNTIVKTFPGIIEKDINELTKLITIRVFNKI